MYYMQLLQLFLIIVAPIAIACFLKIVFMYIGFKKSTYMDATGNTFGMTVFDKGVRGEFLTYEILEKIQKDYKGKILMNVYIPKENGETTEIDGIYINNAGIYVIESKNYSGWIFGSESSQNWTQSLNKRTKNQFYNPIRQNKGHIAHLKKYIGEEIKIDAFNSVIVFSERCELKKVEVKSSDIYVIKRNGLFKHLNKSCKEAQVALSDEDISKLYEMLKPLTNIKEEDKKKHIDNINNKKVINDAIDSELNRDKVEKSIIDINSKELQCDNESNDVKINEEVIKDETIEGLYENLKAYRLKASREDGIKPYMVFTNDQLNILSESKPKTKEEFLKIKGFGEKKFERYGEAILEIVNNEI